MDKLDICLVLNIYKYLELKSIYKCCFLNRLLYLGFIEIMNDKAKEKIDEINIERGIYVLDENKNYFDNLKSLIKRCSILYLMKDKGYSILNVILNDEIQLSSKQLVRIFIPQENLINLLNLRHLDLSNNQIKDLPEELYELKNLEHLYLNNNRIQYISNKISNLINLTILYLQGNEIKLLPKKVCKLEKLLFFHFYYNPIEHLPYKIKFMESASVSLDMLQSINYY